MNIELQIFARDKLREGLSKLPPEQQQIFKLMYCQPTSAQARMKIKDISAHVEKANINDVIDNIEEEKLDWAMQQVQRSLDELNKEPSQAERERHFRTWSKG